MISNLIDVVMHDIDKEIDVVRSKHHSHVILMKSHSHICLLIKMCITKESLLTNTISTSTKKKNAFS